LWDDQKLALPSPQSHDVGVVAGVGAHYAATCVATSPAQRRPLLLLWLLLLLLWLL